jgi:hypothetical protein
LSLLLEKNAKSASVPALDDQVLETTQVWCGTVIARNDVAEGGVNASGLT